MDAKTILLGSLDERWEKYSAEMKTCRKEFSEEAVHDLRVATRRLLAVFDLLRSLQNHKRIQKIRRVLKDQLDELDDLRDVQVLSADVSEFVRDMPKLVSFEQYLAKEEKRLLRRAHKLVKSDDLKGLSKRIGKTREVLEGFPDETLGERILASADEAYSRVCQAYEAMDTENMASIHKLRIAFKKFRYLVEIAHPLLLNFPAENFERMHHYQSRMGDVQDMEVAGQYLTEFFETASPADFEAVSNHYASRLRAAVSNFVKDKGEVQTFWRSSPERSFPWEKPS
jgi:CHAD domain-containing protein